MSLLASGQVVKEEVRHVHDGLQDNCCTRLSSEAAVKAQAQADLQKVAAHSPKLQSGKAKPNASGVQRTRLS